jgi:hypothetical protein
VESKQALGAVSVAQRGIKRRKDAHASRW